jgi:hypothetical protein
MVIGLLVADDVQFIGDRAWLLRRRSRPPAHRASGGQPERDAQPSRSRRRVDWGMLGACCLGGGLLWLVQTSGLGLSQQLFWPVAFACAGAALVWRQADSAEQKKWRAEAGGKVWLAPFVARGGWPALVRVIVGLGLVGAAFGIVIAQQGQIGQLPEVMGDDNARPRRSGGGASALAAPFARGPQSGQSREGSGGRARGHGSPPA